MSNCPPVRNRSCLADRSASHVWTVSLNNVRWLHETITRMTFVRNAIVNCKAVVFSNISFALGFNILGRFSSW